MATNIMTTNTMTMTSSSTFGVTEITSTSLTKSSVVSSSSVTANVSSQSTTGNTTRSTSVLVIVLYTMITATVPLIMLVVILITVYLYRRRQAIYQPCGLSESVIPECQPKAFIVTDKNLELARQLCHHLAEYDIDTVYYQYVENDRTYGPGRLGIPAWAEKWFKESSIILFICNEGFSSIWNDGNINNTRHDSYAEIISITKLLFGGCATDNNLSKFAVVLLQESDHRFIPDLLKNIKSFSVGDTERLARYILEVPTYAPPCCTNNN